MDSIARMDEIISTTETSFQEIKGIPPRDRLTYTNGFYVDCSALFVDIRKSSELPDQHKRRVLARVYRTYISEIAALLNGDLNCADIDIVGDCVSGIFYTPSNTEIASTFNIAITVSSLVDIMNYKFKKKGISEITVGIGLSFGRALMVKAGYKGSNICEVVWVGEVVNEASRIGSYGNKESAYGDKEIMVSKSFYDRLSSQDQVYLSWNSYRRCYNTNVLMENWKTWVDQNCK